MSGAILFLLFLLLPLSGQPVPTPDFPIGLMLTYEAVDEYFMGSTLHSTESFEVLDWLSPDNTSFQLRRGYAQSGDLVYTLRNVSYPSWDYVYYDNEMNETYAGSMYPLWIDVSNWELGQNVSIGFGTYNARVFSITSQETVTVGDVSILCWVVECTFIDVNDWEFTLRHYFDTQYGILIKKYTHRWPGSDDPYNIGTFTDTLVSTNILEQLESSPSLFFGFNLTSVLVFGVVVEIIIITFLYIKRKPK
jgi:hypothetical protein